MMLPIQLLLDVKQLVQLKFSEIAKIHEIQFKK
jgi:hypothetical protein